MKKLMFALFICSTLSVFAQPAVTFSVPATPCISTHPVTLTANFTGLTPPITVTWSVNFSYFYFTTIIPNQIIHSRITTNFDTLQAYDGIPLQFLAVDAVNNFAQGYYQNLPFTFRAIATTGNCPGSPPQLDVYSFNGGTPPYTFQWFNNTTQVVAGTTNPCNMPGPGSYGLTLTDATGCITGTRYSPDTSLTWKSNGPFNFALTATTANCANGTASIGAITGNGLPPYTYLWSNGATSTFISGLTQGNYGVAVTDAQGCSVYQTVPVPQTFINLHPVITPATCTQSDGAVSCFPSGGTPPYTYLYSNGGTGSSQTNLPAGFYGINVNDANGCTGGGFASVTATSPINVTYSSTPSLCTANTGSATLTMMGGTAPYMVQWSTYPVLNGATITNMAPGQYSFIVTDAVGCRQTGIAVISPIHVVTGALSIVEPLCTQTNGSVAIAVYGGTAPYTYLWNTNATTTSISNLSVGVYSVTVKDSAGCKVTKGVNLQASSPVTVGISSTPATCIFTADGAMSVRAAGGTPPYTYRWSNGQNSAAISNLLRGDYYVSVTDAAGCVTNDFAELGYNAANNSCYCTIQGRVYHDANGNCVQDPGEQGLQNIQVHCSGVGYTYTDTSGFYSFIIPSGSYSVSQTIQAYYPLQTCQSNTVAVNVTAASGCTHTVNFADSVNPIHDVKVRLWNNDLPIPGFNYHQRLVITNDGTAPESTIQATYAADGQINTASFLPLSVFNPAGSDRYTASGGFPALQPGASQAFFVNYSVPVNIPLGTNLVFKDTVATAAPLSGWTSDYSPWNNVDYFTTPVVGSFDPNFKAVSPQGSGPTGLISYTDSILEYAVHFQNTGTYFAQNIVVLDTLDTNLDWTTLKPGYQSAPCVVNLNNGIAQFAFKNINLVPQQTNDERSNGMFSYTVKLKKNLPQGTQIKNRAAIYFDYNKPIMTNSTLNTISKTSGVGTVAAPSSNSFFIYPNPAAGSFNAVVISNDANVHARLEITELAGRIVYTKDVVLQKGTQTLLVEPTGIASGIYIATIITPTQKQTQKLVILK